MRTLSRNRGVRFLLALSAATASGSVVAQQQAQPDPSVVVTGVPEQDPSTMAPGPEVKGVIAARNGDKIKVKTADGSSTVISVIGATRIKAGSGPFGVGRSTLGPDSLLNGLPVTVKTLQSNAGLVAGEITFRSSDLKTASMIRNATDQRFDEQTAATAALRGRFGDIDKYNIKSTTNVHFATGKADLSPGDKAELCKTASTAEAMQNALLLVVGYTDSTGGDEINQRLSEKRASRVINYLQQSCGWKPWRMLTPTGMAKADPLASNDTPEGKAQNRRVAVNILVSKAVDGM